MDRARRGVAPRLSGQVVLHTAQRLSPGRPEAPRLRPRVHAARSPESTARQGDGGTWRSPGKRDLTVAYVDFLSPIHRSTKRDYLGRVNEFPKAEAARLAKQ